MEWTKQLSMTVYPVGQGLFTQSDLRVGGKCLRIVYDCGAFRYDFDQVKPYINSLKGHKLDLLVISHFHWDHISYIPKLLKITGGARQIWAPYVAPKLRPLFAISVAAQAELAGHSFADYQDSVAFAANPGGWLQEREFGEVEEIGGPDQEDGEEPPPPPEEEPEGDFEEDDESPGPSRIILSPPQMWPEAFARGSDIKAARSTIRSSGKGRLEHSVTLFTWTKPLQPDKVDDLYKRMADLLSGDASSTLSNYSRLRSNAEISGDDVMKLVQLISQKEGRKGLRRIYNEIDEDLNSTSMFLLAQIAQLTDIPLSSGATPYTWPLGLSEEMYYDLRRYYHHYGWALSMFPGTPDWERLPAPLRDHMGEHWREYINDMGSRRAFPAMLWCGDAPTDTLDKVVEDASDEFRQRMAAATYWQVPHHGARSSLAPKFYDMIRPAFGLTSCGLTNKFGHPNPEVVRYTGTQVVTDASPPFNTSITWK